MFILLTRNEPFLFLFYVLDFQLNYTSFFYCVEVNRWVWLNIHYIALIMKLQM